MKGEFMTFTRGEMRTIAGIIGQFLCKLPLASKQLGHTRPSSSVRDYLRADSETEPLQRAAIQFLVDLFGGMKTQDLVTKWFGEERINPLELFDAFPPEDENLVIDRQMEKLLRALHENGADPAGCVVFVPFVTSEPGEKPSRAHLSFAVAKDVKLEGGQKVESMLLLDAAKAALEHSEELRAAGR